MTNNFRAHPDNFEALLALPDEALVEGLIDSLLAEPAIPVTHPPEVYLADPADRGVPDPSGDHLLNPDFSPLLADRPLKPAAVMIAINMHADQPEVVLTLRTAHLSSHAGQIAFPGGRIDEGETPQEAALREAREEIGLPEGACAVQGLVPSYASRTGYRVYPVVGLVDGWPPLMANPDEVADIFFVPLRFLLDPRNGARTSRMFEGRERFFYTYQYEERRIWGLTAGIIHHMSCRVLSN